MKRKHTPGPLSVNKLPDGNAEITTSDGSVMATVYGDDNDPECWPTAANATLFAAAPELLDACKAALPELSDPFTRRLTDHLRAAIAKAEGREP